MHEGTVIADRYEVRAALGHGGMAEVWEGYDRALDRPVAVKVVRRRGLPTGIDYEKIKLRFTRECRVTAKVEHPGVPVVHDVGTHDGEAYLVMQVVRGDNLGDVIAERGPLPVSWAAALGAQISSVLAAAHGAALVHRDLKPSNIMLCPDGSVKVLDFGIAAVVDQTDLVKLTTTGHHVGSAGYMAPEHILGDQVSPATDLYGLGCVLHELLAGTPPFRAETPYAVLQLHVTAPPPSLRPIRPDVPASLAELVQRLLAKEPGDRTSDATAVYRQLVPYVAEAVTGGAVAAGELGPLRPYYFPFGPLPVVGTTTTLDAPRRGPAPVPAAGAGAAAAGTLQQQHIPAAGALQQQHAQAAGLIEQGRVTQASQVLADAAWAAAAVLGAGHPDVVDARLSLADAYRLGGDHGRAVIELERLVPDLERHFGAGHEQVRRARRNLAECYAQQGDPVRARSLLQAVLDEVRPDRDPGDPELVRLREDLRHLGEGG